MTSQSGPIYEATFVVDGSIVGEFDSWLREHVDNVLQHSGVIDCYACAAPDVDEGHARRVCLYQLADDDALDEFLDGPGGKIDNQVEDRFGSQVSVSARVLREDRREEVSGGSPDCLNCGSYLRGQYCAVCGQRARSRLISLWELVSDAFGDIFELDSRLWQTLVPLVFRPGQLTHDYLQGRRARFMPPFRMYLVLSLLFFAVAFFDPREDLGLLFEPAPPAASTGEVAEQPVADAAAVAAQAQIDRLVEEGVIAAEDAPDLSNRGFNLRLGGGDVQTSDCDVDEADIKDLPGWLQRRLTVERLRQVCERTRIDGGRAFLDKLIDNIPAALIVLLPVMAFVLKVLYPLSRRYYVEHLLFFVHFHAFFFLILSVQILLMRAAALAGVPEAIPTMIVVIGSFYIPVYLFVAMRRVYGQGRFVTMVKYIALQIAYVMGFTATMLGALALAAFEV